MNVTAEISTATGFFRQYLLGESIKNFLIRLTVILSAIIIVWSGIILALIIYMKYQRARQMLKTSNTQQLYDSNSSLTTKRFNQYKRNRRLDSSASILMSPRCYSIRHYISELHQRCIFWSSSRSDNENTIKRSSTKRKQQTETMITNSCTISNTIQIVAENMTRRPLNPNQNINNTGRKISFFHEIDHSSGDESINICSIEDEQKPQIEINRKTSNVVQLVEPTNYIHHPSISFPLNENKDDHQKVRTHLQKLHEFNTKATLFFHPITRRLSNINTNSCLPPVNAMQQRKSLLVVSSARELTSNNEYKWNHALVNEKIVPDENTVSTPRQLPLVMITDTNSSNTNIVELETYEDNHRLVSDIEKRLARELRATYRPRHST